MKLTLENNSSVYIKEYTPTTESYNSLILFIPALGTPAAYYTEIGEEFAKQGYLFVTLELRGQGEDLPLASRKRDFGYEQLIDNDVRFTLSYLRKQYPHTQIVLAGHSLGAQLAVLYSSRYEASPVNKNFQILAIASATPYYKYFRTGLYFMTYVFNFSSALLGYFPGKQLGFAGREARTLMKDWCGLVRSNQYNFNNSTSDYEAALPILSTSVKSVSFEGDNFAPMRGIQGWLDKLSQCEVSYQTVNAGQLELKRLNHMNWTKVPKRVVPILLAVLDTP